MTRGFLLIVVGSVAFLVLLFFGVPQWRVYQQRLSGMVEVARAQQNRRIAEFDAQAEIVRARGVAEANRIIADGLGGPEGYLRYLWVQAIKDTRNQVVYVPTEAALPILEAGRLPARAPAQ